MSDSTHAPDRWIRWFKEPASAGTHFLGFLLAVAGLGHLAVVSAGQGAKTAGMWIYGLSLALLFLASSAYHFIDLGERGNRWLRRLDHGAIYLLVAGTYVPPLLHLLDGAWRIAMLSVVAGLAMAGVVFKLVWIDCPTWLSTLTYLVLGWIVVIPGPLLLPQLPAWPLLWLVAGGLAYSVGAAVYVLERPDPWPGRFGHHEVWHLFVLAGAAAHFVFTAWLLDVPAPPFG
jgi:hemolysin III